MPKASTLLVTISAMVVTHANANAQYLSSSRATSREKAIIHRVTARADLAPMPAASPAGPNALSECGATTLQ